MRFSSLYKQFRIKEILVKPILKVHGVEVLSFILGDSFYPIRPYLIKNYRSKNARVNKIKFDSAMNG